MLEKRVFLRVSAASLNRLLSSATSSPPGATSPGFDALCILANCPSSAALTFRSRHHRIASLMSHSNQTAAINVHRTHNAAIGRKSPTDTIGPTQKMIADRMSNNKTVSVVRLNSFRNIRRR